MDKILNFWLFCLWGGRRLLDELYSNLKKLILTDERSTFYTIVFAVVEKKRDQCKAPDRCRTLHEFG
jgi:hypothetical protein